MDVLPLLVPRWGRVRDRNFPLRSRIEARVCFAARLDRACRLAGRGRGSGAGEWSDLRGPARVTVGTDAFMISAPQALSEWVFTGRESTIAFARMRFGPAGRDWIVITGRAGGKPVRLAITSGNVPEVWRALESAGATFVA